MQIDIPPSLAYLIAVMIFFMIAALWYQNIAARVQRKAMKDWEDRNNSAMTRQERILDRAEELLQKMDGRDSA